MICLKRFAFNSITKQPEKITRHISYSMVFTPVTGVQYQLRAVVVHKGGYGAGHYVAYVRASNNQWCFCDDSNKPRTVADPTEVEQQQAYMLFYERVDVLPERLIVPMQPHAL